MRHLQGGGAVENRLNIMAPQLQQLGDSDGGVDVVVDDQNPSLKMPSGSGWRSRDTRDLADFFRNGQTHDKLTALARSAARGGHAAAVHFHDPLD